MREKSDLDILAELGVEPIRKAKTANTPREARIIAGFEDIQKFVEEHGRPPMHGEGRDISERLYAVRLDRLRAQPGLRPAAEGAGSPGPALSSPPENAAAPSEMDDDALLATLGVEPHGGAGELKHVRPLEERRAADDVAVRHPCHDFAPFEPIFAAVKSDLANRTRPTAGSSANRRSSWAGSSSSRG